MPAALWGCAWYTGALSYYILYAVFGLWLQLTIILLSINLKMIFPHNFFVCNVSG